MRNTIKTVILIRWCVEEDIAEPQYDGGVDNQDSTNVKSSNYANLMIAQPNANLCQLTAMIYDLMSLLKVISMF